MRVGIGYDIHQLEDGRPLILGGIEIPFNRGLKGHSDADCVLHAIIDSLFGAAGLGDIGEHFPDTDPQYAGADSTKLLTAALKKISDAGFCPVNVDINVHIEKPKLGEYKRKMAKRISKLLNIPSENVNIKAKTSEGLGPIGVGDAIAGLGRL